MTFAIYLTWVVLSMLGLAMGLGWIKLPGMVHAQEKNIQMLVFVAVLVKKDAYKTPK